MAQFFKYQAYLQGVEVCHRYQQKQQQVSIFKNIVPDPGKPYLHITRQPESQV